MSVLGSLAPKVSQQFLKHLSTTRGRGLVHLVSFWDFLKLLSHHFLNLKTLPCQRECFIREGMTDKRHTRMV